MSEVPPDLERAVDQAFEERIELDVDARIAVAVSNIDSRLAGDEEGKEGEFSAVKPLYVLDKQSSAVYIVERYTANGPEERHYVRLRVTSSERPTDQEVFFYLPAAGYMSYMPFADSEELDDNAAKVKMADRLEDIQLGLESEQMVVV